MCFAHISYSGGRCAWQAGRLLAQLLMQGGHGDRPVTLIGYSMGARLVFHCLLELARNNCKGAEPLEGDTANHRTQPSYQSLILMKDGRSETSQRLVYRATER